MKYQSYFSRKKILAISLYTLILLPTLANAATPANSPFLTPGIDVSNDSGLPSISTASNATTNKLGPTTTPSLTQNYIREKQKSTFATYTEAVTGVTLPIFGNELFQSAPTTFAPLDAVQVNSDYTIGSGDEIQIRGWGMVDIDLSVTVDRSGNIYLPRVGTVKVSGIKYRDLQGYLKKAVSRVFTNFDLTASISQTRALQIYVAGHAVRPGTYTLNAMSSLLNALFSSGGPSGTGSMRNIQLKRNGTVITTFDMYDMLVNGDKSHDASLQDGDVIYIPEVGPLIALLGNVKRPAIYELNGNNTLADAEKWAGGLDSAAEEKEVIIEKNVDNKYQTIALLQGGNKQLQVNLKNYPLTAGEIIRVFSPGAIPVTAQQQREFVTVGGEAAKTGVFEIKRGETLRELMSRLGGTTDVGYLYGTQLKRESLKKTQQEKLNQIADRFEKELDTTTSQRLASLTDKDSIASVQAEAERQRMVIQKMRTVQAEGRIVLELNNAKATIKNLPDLPLRDGDNIYIPRRPDTIDVVGAVNQQSSYIYKPNRNISDYLSMAGGPSKSGDQTEMYVIHADGTVDADGGWLRGIGGTIANPGDTLVIPEKIDRTSWVQSVKEWTAILYQFGLGAAGLKVLK
jgi:protein involved in polysaccharide export with SLBB domain